MKTTKPTLMLAALMLGGLAANGQSHDMYQFIFYGTAYQTNSAGVLVGKPINVETLLKSRAAQGGITNLSKVAMVYHINGGSLGDTIDIISTTNGAVLTTEFGFYFGSDAALGRTAVGTAATSGQRRVDPIYTFDDSEYTYSNPDSVGAAFTYKRFVVGAKTTNAIINGTMSWTAIPTGTNTSPVLCTGTFSIGKPMD